MSIYLAATINNIRSTYLPLPIITYLSHPTIIDHQIISSIIMVKETKKQQEPPMEPIAVLGYSMELPQGINDADKYVQLIREKKQNSVDLLENGLMDPEEYDETTEGNPWQQRTRRSNFFGADEGMYVGTVGHTLHWRRWKGEGGQKESTMGYVANPLLSCL